MSEEVRTERTEDGKKQSLNQTLFIVRIIASISVVCAHVPLEGSVLPTFICRLINIFSSIGAPAFLIVSAYFYDPAKHGGLFRYLRKRLFDLVIPWLISGVIVYFLYNYTQISFSGIIKWVFGFNSYLWYMPVLFLCYIAFFPLYKKLWFLICISMLGITSLIVTASGVIDNIFGFEYFSKYILFTNWIFFFALGCIIKKYDLFNKIIDWNIKPLLLIPYVVICVVFPLFKTSSGYFSYYGFFVEIVGFFFIFIFAFFIRHLSFLIIFSRYSFHVYLYHFIGIWAVKKAFELLNASGLKLTIILCVTVIMYLGFWIIDIICKKFKLQKVSRFVFGLR